MGWIWRSRHLWGRGAALLVAVVTLLSCQTSRVTSGPLSPKGNGVVTGVIILCGGVPTPDGTVAVLKGQVTAGLGSSGPVFPTTVVAQERVATNATYRFVLKPGDYVLHAQFPSPANVIPFTNITLRAGDNLSVDIPTVCK
jgi:hypothetical protein